MSDLFAPVNEHLGARTLFTDGPAYIGIIGSRRRNSVQDYVAVAKAFFRVFRSGDIVVSGGCPKGADRFAEALAAATQAQLVLHMPNRAALRQELPPRAAYAEVAYARNTLVARDSRDYLIACVASDRKGGTEDTIKKHKRLHPKAVLILV